MQFSNKIQQAVAEAEAKISAGFKQIEQTALVNQQKVLECFQKNRIQSRHFAGTTGYGYDDAGRNALARVFADVFNTDAAIVSPSIANGTHALTLALFGILRPKDKFVSLTGELYDTLNKVIYGDNIGSLKDFDIGFDKIDLLEDGSFDHVNIADYLAKNKVKMAFIQRSRGYSWRNALSVSQIGQIIKQVKAINKDIIVAVDNCYGEFVDVIEPTDVDADIIIGSLIKNPGGGIAPTGAYIAGKEALIQQISYRLTSPSLGTEVGSNYLGYLPYFQGLFMAPAVVASALKGSLLFGQVYSDLGYETMPKTDSLAGDIIRSIKFNADQPLIDFCRAIQKASPVDSDVSPEPWEMPGYKDKVIMAAGAFIQGSSIELSADSPLRPPYIAYLQGGLTYEHAKLAVMYTLKYLNI